MAAEPSLDTAAEKASAHPTGHTVGRTSEGRVFKIPPTFNTIEIVSDPKCLLLSPASWFFITCFSLTLVTMWLSLPTWAYVLHFLIWRMFYNAGLGILLHMQSHDRAFEAIFNRWIGEIPKPLLHVFESSVVFKDPSIKYSIRDFPDAFNAWMAFRFIANLVLGLDMFSFMVLWMVEMRNCYWVSSAGGVADLWGLPSALLVTILGIALCVIAAWTKSDAHRVLGDYAWFWGDFFFRIDQALVFDGVFSMFPHPMYTAGYLWMYGASLLAQSHVLFCVSVVAHVAQLAFLALVEEPHIGRTYGSIVRHVADPLMPLSADDEQIFYSFSLVHAHDVLLVIAGLFNAIIALMAPSWVSLVVAVVFRGLHFGLLIGVLQPASQGQNWWLSVFEKAHAKKLRTLASAEVVRPRVTLTRSPRADGMGSLGEGLSPPQSPAKAMAGSHGKLPSDTASPATAGPVAAGSGSFSSAGAGVTPARVVEGDEGSPTAVGGQSSDADAAADTNACVCNAWAAWKKMLYCFTTLAHVSFGVAAVRYAMDGWGTLVAQGLIPQSFVSRFLLGGALVGINMWVSYSTFSVIGEFGFAYGDFFLAPSEQVAPSYGGIYRYMNNPDSVLGLAAYYGLALIAGSIPIILLAAATHAATLVFLYAVERPYMRKIYSEIRVEGGLLSELRRGTARAKTSIVTLRERVKAARGMLEEALAAHDSSSSTKPLVQSVLHVLRSV